MKAFEFHFNTKTRDENIYDSFIFEPGNIDEIALGSLYLVGELNNVLPQNARLLDKIASNIKRVYYLNLKTTPEQGLKEGLKEANHFLSKESKKGNIGWLGNLNLAILSLKGYTLNFTKVGNIKILILRNDQIIDVGRNLDFQEIDSHSSKIFGNTVSGKLGTEDKILILTEDLFEFFFQANLLKKLATALNSPVQEGDPSIQKKIQEVFRPVKKELVNVPGICFLAFPSSKTLPVKKEGFWHSLGQTQEDFLLKKFFLSLLLSLFRLSVSFVRKFPSYLSLLKKVKIPSQISKIKVPSKISKPRIPSLPLTSGLPKKYLKSLNLKDLFSKARATKKEFKRTRLEIKEFIFSRKSILIISLIFVLMAGSVLFNGGREEKLEQARQTLQGVQNIVNNAGRKLMEKDREAANDLLKKAWNNITPLTKRGSPLRKEAAELKLKIEENLAKLNYLEKKPDIEPIFKIETRETSLIPQKILVLDSNIFFFTPFSKNIYKVDLNTKEGQIFQSNYNLKSGIIFEDNPLFFSKPNTLLSFENDEFEEKTLQMASPETELKDLSFYQSNLYFLDAKANEIIRYKNPLKGQATPQLWLSPNTKRPTKAISIAVDDGIWILNEDDSLYRYFLGEYKKTVELKFFPVPTNLSKIYASLKLPYIYLLDPLKKRIIIVNDSGEVVKQFQSEKFDKLLDFAVSEDGKIIYLLNGAEVYQIDL